MEQIWWVQGFSDVSVVKNLPASARDLGLIPGSGRSPGEGNAIHSRILAGRTSRTEEPGGLQSMGSPRVRYDLVTDQQQHDDYK